MHEIVLTDDGKIDVSAYTTYAEAAEEFGVSEQVVRQWVHRAGVEAVGQYPDRTKIFLHVDLARAERKFRDRAPDRGDPMIAGLQALKRAQRAAARTRTAA